MGHVERRKRETLVQFLWHVSDLLAVAAAFMIGYWLRFDSPLVGHLWSLEKGIPPLGNYVSAALVTAVIWMVVFHAFGLYRRRLRWGSSLAPRMLQASLLGMALTAALAFFYREFTYSRIAIPLIWMLAIPLLYVGRGLMLQLAARLLRGRKLRFVIVGRTPHGRRIAQALVQDGLGIHEALGVLAGPGEDTAAHDDDPFPILGRHDEIGRIVEQMDVDRVIVALPFAGQVGLIEILRQCHPTQVDVEFVPDLFSLISHEMHFDEIDGIPIAGLCEIPLAGWNGVLKRTLDLFLTVPLLLCLAPLLLGIGLAIKLESPGPVFYHQARVGRDRRVFQMIKFRSMRVDAESGTGPVWAENADPRRTRMGTFLRTWSLDELPQLLNVLRGQMSLVGPRPERPFFVERFEELIPGYFDRHRVKSGITGWAQVNGLRGNVPIEERTRYDLYYIENWSLGFDLRILLLTLRSIIAQRGQ